MFPAWLTPRLVFLGLFLACVGLMGFGYYLQYGVGLEPCPLCMTQRVFFVVTGLTALVAALHGPGRFGRRGYAVLVVLFCLLGGAFSGRHLWLQSLPADRVPACGPSIDYILDTFPPMEALEILLRGTGDCAVVDWSLFGIAIPGWALIAFTGMAITAIWAGWFLPARD